MTQLRVPGSLQLAIAAAMSQFIEVIIADDVCFEVRTDTVTCGFGRPSPSSQSWSLCDAARCQDA